MKRYYKIGDFRFAVESDQDLRIPAHFSLFETDEEDAETVYEIQMVDQLPELTGTTVHKTDDMIITEEDGLESRCISIYGTGRPYAVYKESDDGRILIYLDASREEEVLSYDTTFSSMFALEKRMWERDSLILHSCSVTYRDGEAILFSAPSGTGKSTQGELWRQNRGSRVINGDRNLLSRRDGSWYMRGWPVCGSSEICHNEEYPIKAIVMLEQAPEDHIERLEGMKAYARVFPEITCNRWNRTRLEKTMDQIETLINEVPVYLLKCTVSGNSVDILDHKLTEQEQNNE